MIGVELNEHPCSGNILICECVDFVLNCILRILSGHVRARTRQQNESKKAGVTFPAKVLCACIRNAQWEIFTTLHLVNYYLEYSMEDGKVPSCT